MSFKVKINICRVCVQTENGESILACASLKRKFMFTTRLQIREGDDLPNIICRKCKIKLKIAYDFIVKAQSSENELKRFLAKINNDFQDVANGLPKKIVSEEDSLLSFFDETYDEMDDNYMKAVEPLAKRNTKIQAATEAKRCSSTESTPLSLYDKGELVIKCENFLEELIIDETKNLDYQTKSAIADAEAEERADEESIAFDDVIVALPETGELEENTTKYDGFKNSYLQEYENMLSQNEPDEADMELLENKTMPNEFTVDAINDESVNTMDDAEQADEEEGDDEEEEDYSDNVQKDEITVMQLIDANNEDKPLTTAKKNASRMRAHTIDKANNFNSRPGRPPNKCIKTKFYCIKCNRDFSTKTNLTRHLATHEGKKPYQCNVCGKGFTQNGSLKQHMYTHTGEKPYICNQCGRGFTQSKSLVIHMRRHTGERPFRCDYCGTFFRQKDGLKTHVLKQHTITKLNGSESTHICKICKRQFPTVMALQTHMKKHVNNSKTITTHSLADASEISMDALDEDELMDSDKDSLINADYPLNIDDSMQIVDVMATSTADLNRAKKFQCRKCFKRFAIKVNLIRHLSIHSTPMSELFTCNKCEIAFDSSFALKHHLVKEHHQVGINLTECDECQIVFFDETELTKHIENTHNMNCSECPNLIFTSQRALLQHNMMQHDVNGDTKLLESNA